MRRLLRCGLGARALDPLATPHRRCATTPTEDDVLRAYQTLGVQATASLADVKKRYGTLAKEHHPDVATSTATSSTTRMTDINAAYNTVKQFYQAGGRLAGQRGASGGGGSSASSRATGSSAYYTNHDSAYQPWYEDMDPLMYELMWEEMRRQNEEENFGAGEGGYPGAPGGQWRPPRGNFAGARNNKQRSQQQQQQQQQGKGGADKNNNTTTSTSTTTWPEEQVKAMVNMYQDGKSFEFIANALGKANAAAIVEEFNRWSADNSANRRRSNTHNNNRRRRRPPNRPHGFYHTQSPDDIPFELYEMMAEEPYYEDGGDSFGYHTGDGESYEETYGDATPFYGTHQMSGGVPPYMNNGGGGRTYNSSRNASFRPQRHHRGGNPHRPKRSNNGGNNR